MLGKMKTIIRKLDLFYSNQIIRYNGQGQYKTLTGGVFSIFIITILLYAFWNMIIGTMEKTTITFQMMTTRNQVPPAITIGTDQQSKFMIGIQLRSLNLQLTPKFFKNNQIFHLVAYQLLSINQTYGNYSFIPLEYCTKQNWKSIPYMYNNFETLKIQDWICFPKNLILDMQGKPTTERFSGFSFEVHPCKNSTYKNDCAPQEIIDQVHKNYTNFMVLVNMVNNIINPNSQDPVSNFVFTKSAVISKSYGTILWMDVSDFKIQTDTTVLPYQTIETKKGYLFEQITNTNLFVASNGLPLFRLAVKKSDKSIIYKRQVQKLSYVVSFVGGYIGIIILSLFSVKLYTQAALSINLGLDIFKDEIIANNQQNYSFNIFNYIKLIYYRLSQWLGKDLNWPQQKAVSLMQEEVQHQLDINQIISRIMQLQNIMTFILQIEIIQGMKYIKSITCQKAAQLRKMFSLSKVQNKKNKKTSKKQKYKQEVIHQIKKVQMVDNQLFSPSQLRQAPIKQLKKNINEKKYSAQVQHISEFNSMKQSRFKPTNKIVNQYGYQCKVQDNLKDKEMKQLQQTSKIQNLKKIQRLSRNSKVHRRFWDSIDNNLQKMIEDLNENSVLQKQKIESAQSQSIQ